jgi:phosphate transport system substrate-binding protein
MSGEYSPLSRPLFIYVTTSALQRPEVAAFIDFYLANVSSLAAEVGYIALPAEAYDAISAHLAAGKTGSSFLGKDTVGLTIQEVLAAEK